MKNSTQATNKLLDKVRFSKSWKIILAVALVAGLAVLSAVSGRQIALADTNNVDLNHSITFTKWVTAPGTAPVLYKMAGIVSGDSGGGQYVGEVLDITSTQTTTTIKALYHINGGAHQFTARVFVTQNNKTGVAVISGLVTDGWLKGAQVRGDYQTVAPCGILNAQPGPFGDTCFQGTLHIILSHE